MVGLSELHSGKVCYACHAPPFSRKNACSLKVSLNCSSRFSTPLRISFSSVKHCLIPSSLYHHCSLCSHPSFPSTHWRKKYYRCTRIKPSEPCRYEPLLCVSLLAFFFFFFFCCCWWFAFLTVTVHIFYDLYLKRLHC